MHQNRSIKEEQNFWISYADLMAGLLFVFVLLVGAIVLRYVYVQKSLGHTKSALSDKDREIRELNTKLKDLLLSFERDTKNLKTKLSQMQDIIDEDEHLMAVKDDDIIKLQKLLLQKSIEHQKLVDELNITKIKIKNLTGIKIMVISKLKDTLGNSIVIDPKSGAIRFSSNILFSQGSSVLKPDAKYKLKEILTKYIHTLLFDPEIRSYIEQITIEGHTNSDGSYLKNLALSQKRAFAVMKFLYESDVQNRDLYSYYLNASGRSFSDLIYDEYGNEDKDASRRIEIKFRIKNEKAIKELEKFLKL